jgi:hypothetical protein
MLYTSRFQCDLTVRDTRHFSAFMSSPFRPILAGFYIALSVMLRRRLTMSVRHTAVPCLQSDQSSSLHYIQFIWLSFYHLSPIYV